MNTDIQKVYDKCKKFGLAGDKKGWLESVNRGIIDIGTVLQQIKMTKEAKVLKVHKTAISQLENGRWQTTVKDDTKSSGRYEIKLSTYEKVIDRLYDFYFTQNIDNLDKIRLCDIFQEWLDYKCKKKNNASKTKKQNLTSYTKYVKGSKIDIPLKTLKTIDLEDWAINVLLTYERTAKTFNAHKSCVTGPLSYAKRKGYITENMWHKEELEYTHLFKSKRKKASECMIFYPDEIEELLVEFERGYSLNGNIANLGLMINFELGLRIGELCCLKWSDISWKNETIFIERMESEGKVVDYVKSDSEAGYRELSLSDEVISLFKRVRRDSKLLSEFIFTTQDGSRADKMVFVHRLEKAEIALGWKESGTMKRSHCIRRTVASRMQAEGWTIEEIRVWLGHTNTETTLTYLYNPFRVDERKEKVKRCSILHTNKKCLQVSTQNNEALEDKKMLEAL